MAKATATEAAVYTQIGITALRDPVTGDFLPAVPLYIKASPDEINPKTGIPKAEELALEDVGKVFAEKMKQYIDGGGKLAHKRKAGTSA